MARDVIQLEAGHTYRIEIQVAWSRQARRRGAHHAPKGWDDVRPVSCLLDESNDMEAYTARASRRYAKANPRPLAADGLSYHRRYLARKRRRS